MKRLIFSLFNNITIPHTSVPQSKKDSFHEFYDRLVEAQKAYAHRCGAEYIHYTPEINDYDDIQFEKLYRFEELTNDYDEIVYLDLDVIPTTEENVFDRHASNENVGVHFIDVQPNWGKRNRYDEWWVTAYNLDKMNMVVKTCAKNSMLMLKDISGDNRIANTGVMIGNKNSIQNLCLSERLKKAEEIFEDAKDDNLYPKEIASLFSRNNEVYFSFIKEFYNVSINPIGLGWNFILDEMCTGKRPGIHMHHAVNKDFKVFF